IRPAIVMVVILRMMTALSAFAAIFAATGGGPGSATEILNLYAYRTSFSELNLGYGAALAVVLMRAMEAMLFGLVAADPWALAAVSAAVAAAALLEGAVRPIDGPVVAVLTGSNLDAHRLARILEEG
ncbi:MAG TPA: hypothetical protein VFS20_09145, partial [Longimicrobium sp.]|nr:hypothetical protein [Longimicrobium sp.]